MNPETAAPDSAVAERPQQKGLKDIVEEARKRTTERAAGSITGLGEVAAELELNEIARLFGGVRQELLSDTFKLIVVGRFKNGKSTLLNALLGRASKPLPAIFGDHGPLPVDNLPATATLTSIRYADEPWVKAWGFDGKSEDWSLERYLEESTVRLDEEENRRVFSKIRNFELGFPTELCRSGVTLIDSPGTDDVPHRSEITRQALDRADAAIVVFRSDALAGQGERRFVSQELLQTQTRIFTVINLFHDQKVNRRLEGATWERVVTQMMGGPKWQNEDWEDLREKGVYFIQGRDAEKGKLEDSAELIERSGLQALEGKLGDFLVRERHRVHLERFIGAALRHAKALEQQVERRQAGLERESAELAQAYDEILPRLAAVDERRDKLPKILDRYRRESSRELDASFSMMLRDLRRDLPGELASVELEALEGLPGLVRAAFKQRELCQQMLDVCAGIAKQRFDAWHKSPATEPGAQQTLEPIFERMMEEISDEVGEIERDLSEIQLQVTGWQPGTEELEEPLNLKNRVLGVLAGVLLQDPSLVLGGGVGGLRGVVGSLGGLLASGFGLGILGAMGFAIGPLILPAALIGALLGSMTWNRMGLEERLRRTALEAFFEKLDEAADFLRSTLQTEVDRIFEEAEEHLMSELASAILSEEESIQGLMRLNELSRAEKQEVLARLAEANEKIRGLSEELREVELEAAQVA